MSVANSLAEIKPCPFCDSDNLALQAPDTFYMRKSCWVKCLCCGAFGPIKQSNDDAIAVWNAAPRKDDIKQNIEAQRLYDLRGKWF